MKVPWKNDTRGYEEIRYIELVACWWSILRTTVCQNYFKLSKHRSIQNSYMIGWNSWGSLGFLMYWPSVRPSYERTIICKLELGYSIVLVYAGTTVARNVYQHGHGVCRTVANINAWYSKNSQQNRVTSKIARDIYYLKELVITQVLT